MQKERLTRSTHNRWVAGVCGGIAEYFGWNADVLRLVWLFFPGFAIYLVLWLIMPAEE